MARRYTIPIPIASIADIHHDFAEINVPADAVVCLHEIKVTQSSEFGDAATRQISFEVIRAFGSFTSGTGGTSATFSKHESGDAAYGGTGEVNNTTIAQQGSGTFELLATLAENSNLGLHHLPTPEDRYCFSPSQTLIVRLIDGVPSGEAITFLGYVVIEEMGG